jgi:hypothetical protein
MSGDLEQQDWELGFSAAKPPLAEACTAKGYRLKEKAEAQIKAVSKISDFARNIKFDNACQTYEEAVVQFKVGCWLLRVAAAARAQPEPRGVVG